MQKNTIKMYASQIVFVKVESSVIEIYLKRSLI